MRKLVLIALLALTAGAAHAQESNNPNDSTYPASNQPNAFPNDPDHIYGRNVDTHTLPSGISPLSGTTSNPNKPVIPDKTAMPSDDSNKDQ